MWKESDLPTGVPNPSPIGGKRARRRDALLDAMADHLLANGLASSSLRTLAEAAGTSDRMLLYYFADRDALLTALLDHVVARMTAMLGAFGNAAERPAGVLLAELWAAARTPAFSPFMLLFIELAAAAGSWRAAAPADRRPDRAGLRRLGRRAAGRRPGGRAPPARTGCWRRSTASSCFTSAGLEEEADAAAGLDG